MTKKKVIKKYLLAVFFWTLLLASFIFFAGVIVLKANGYQINSRSWSLMKTGMIVLDGFPKNAVIHLNNKTLKSGFPERIGNLSVGTYTVKIASDGYWSWQKNIRVEEGLASVYDNIILFYQKPVEAKAPENFTQDDLKLESANLQQGLRISNSEIYYQDKLITRFSQPVLGAILYPDRKHLIFQLGNNVRVIDIDGSNDNLLLTLGQSEPSTMAIRDNGQTLIYLDNGIITAKTIR